MCNCAEEKIKRLSEKHPTFRDKKVKKYTFSGETISITSGGIETIQTLPVDIEFENQKKRGLTLIQMIYCPFCGDKYASKIGSTGESKSNGYRQVARNQYSRLIDQMAESKVNLQNMWAEISEYFTHE